MGEKLLRIGITQGDTNGIAYELILKAFEDQRLYEFCIPVLYGSSKILAYHRKALELPSYNLNNISHAQEAGTNRLNVLNITQEDVVVELGRQTPDSIKASEEAFSKAWLDLKEGNIDVLIDTPAVIDPLQKRHCELEENNGKVGSVSMLINNSLRIGFATDKISFSDISPLINQELLVKKIEALHYALVHDFMITSPRIAVLALNPQAGINEQPGKEELEVIIPALKKANDLGMFCFGPYSADTFFSTDKYLDFDACLALYHDQGMIAFQTLTGGEGVKYIANLPFICTAPNETVSFERAGKNISTPDAFRNALYLAVDLYQNRVTDKQINKNPLRKQYFERGSDNEKLDLTKEES
ncbi:4-hydroxythreonine-4-phosphate dehydrogenase PdxA [Bacteroidales bacterium OttesenSCG-928-M06]|nr:4-hydroxythreonine-4-phosphate dehydrogenase PdxA [Bacteroidales bacterium OttesenSCG-928-M06]